MRDTAWSVAFLFLGGVLAVASPGHPPSQPYILIAAGLSLLAAIALAVRTHEAPKENSHDRHRPRTWGD